MACWEIKHVRIKGVAAVVPKEIVNSHDYSFFSEDEAKSFINTVGIENRHIAPDNVCASDLCFEAAEKLIKELGWDKNEIGILSFASVTGDYRTPPTSCILQHRLNLPVSCFTLDIPMGCCGCIYSMNVIGNMMSAGTVRKALLLIGDTAARMGSPKDKSRVPLFGDCGTAIALEYDPLAEDILVEFNTLGSGYEALMTPHGGFRHPIERESFEYEDFGNGIIRAPMHTLIHGMDVFSFAISRPPKSILDFLSLHELDKDIDIDYFLIHQANKMIVDRIVKKLKLDVAKVPYNLQQYGNLGGASIPTLMVTNLRKELQCGTYTLLLSAFGLGLSWGTMILKTSDLVIPELITI